MKNEEKGKPALNGGKEQGTKEVPQEKLEDIAIAGDLLGTSSIKILGRELRPFTLASLALLTASGSELMDGTPAHAAKNLVLDCCKLVVLQSGTLKEARKLVRDLEKLEEEAYLLAEDIPAGNVNDLVKAVSDLVADLNKDQMEPIAPEGAAPNPEAEAVLGE